MGYSYAQLLHWEAIFDTLKPKQYDWQCADDILKCVLENKMVIMIEIALLLVLELPIDNGLALVRVKGLSWTGVS